MTVSNPLANYKYLTICSWYRILAIPKSSGPEMSLKYISFAVFKPLLSILHSPLSVGHLSPVVCQYGIVCDA